MKTEVALFDLDGTLADNQHRQTYVDGEKKDWDAFFNAQIDDTPIVEVVGLYNALQASGRYELIIVTARPERYRAVTRDWFSKHHLNVDKLIMRADGDRRSDDIVKREILQRLRSEGFNPVFVVDDRNSVVNMWRSEGLVCFQCADHDF